jgi:1-acyl-sn-glycerol-3-phosphate acyltransferase
VGHGRKIIVSLLPSLRTIILAPARVAYTAWVLASFLCVGMIVLLMLVVLPRLSWRRAAARALARVFLHLAGMPLTVKFAQRLPEDQCVVVCNHASYLDGIVLTAALPPRFGFVIKREMASVPVVGALLGRLGSEFVERFNRSRGARDALRLMRQAIDGHSLVFFPEGTFTRTPGLLKFHTGAFVSAVRAGCPVVPAIVRGTRRGLSPSGALPLPGPLELEILPALAPRSPPTPDEVSELCASARAAILAGLGEPDLTCCDDTDRPPGTAPARSARVSRP